MPQKNAPIIKKNAKKNYERSELIAIRNVPINKAFAELFCLNLIDFMFSSARFSKTWDPQERSHFVC